MQIEKNQYPRFTDFRRFVIEPSIKEIEKKSDWMISWEPVKKGRKITSLTFIFNKNEISDIGLKNLSLQRSIINSPQKKTMTPEEYASLHPRKTYGKTTKEVIDMMRNDD